MSINGAATAKRTSTEPVDKVLAVLRGVRKTGHGWQAICPAHDDRTASLSINLGNDGATVLMKCHAGCDNHDVVKAAGLELSDLFRSNLKLTAANGNTHKRQIVAVYDYDGFQVVRHEPKGFTQRRPDGTGGWVYNLHGITPCLYHHDEIVKSDDIVIVVEGEKDADRLREQGAIATTSPMGAGKWRPQYTSALAGREVVLLPDNDPPGRQHMERVAAELHAAGCTVWVIDLPGLEDHEDVSDWLDLGYTVDDDLVDMIRKTPEWAPADYGGDPSKLGNSESHHEASSGFQLINAEALMKKEFPAPRWAVPNLIAEGLSLLVGAPKLGKSWLALSMCVAVASGGRALGKIRVDAGDALYLALEDTERRIQERLRMVLQGETAPRRLTVTTVSPTLADGAAGHIRAWLAGNREARVIVIDTFQKLRGPVSGNQNLYSGDYAAAGELKRLADDYGVAIVLVHHTRKATADDPLDMVSGTTGLAGAADTTCVLRREIGRADATLYIRGRDVPEADHALSFDAATCSWTLLGDAVEFRVSAERKAIIDILTNAPEPMSPKHLAEALGKKDGAVRKLLHMMVRAGEVDGLGGAYRLPVKLGNDGNSGNDQAYYAQTVTTVTAVTGNEETTPPYSDMVPTAGHDRWTR